MSTLPLQMSDGPPPESLFLHALPSAQPTDGELIAQSDAEPKCFTQEQVVQMAEQVTYNP